MKPQDAFNLLGIVGEGITLEQCKAAYKKAALTYHPDINPAGIETMKAINLAWECIQELDWNTAQSSIDSADRNYGTALNQFLNKIIGIRGLRIEVCGNWVWIGGDTRQYKDLLKESGAYWASAKKMWYFRPSEYKSCGRGKWSMDKIRDAYGSEELKGQYKGELR